MRQMDADDLRDVVKVQAPVAMPHAFDDLDIGIQDAFIADALEKERRQHQTAVYAQGHSVARELQRFGDGGAAGGDHDPLGGHAVGDQLFHGLLAFLRRERRTFARGAKDRDATATCADQ